MMLLGETFNCSNPQNEHCPPALAFWHHEASRGGEALSEDILASLDSESGTAATKPLVSSGLAAGLTQVTS